MAAPAEAIVPAVKVDENLVHTDVMLFNRWSYDDVQVIILHSIFCLCAATSCNLML